MDSWAKLLVLSLVCMAALTATAQQQDAAALLALRNEMKNTPPSWGQTSDPCGAPVWDGITCNNSRVVGLKLYNMGLEGTLSSDIGSLSELQTLNLAYNNKLGGPLPSAIGNLKQLNTLILIDCSFNGSIPDVLGNMTQLSYLALNSNNFTSNIPASLGNLFNLFWLDLAENQLTGPLPISTNTTPGLDQLFKAKHFHLNQNQLSGPIPGKLFSSNLIAIHILLDRNQFTGRIPDSIGLVQTLKIIRLDNNSLSGPVPSSINNLTQLNVLNLANNKLTGQMPNLTGMHSLNSVDLSNNSFDPSEAPSWISELQSIRSLAIESGGLYGEVPQKLFSFPELQQVILRNNAFNGTLDMGSNISRQLQLVDLQNNSFTSVALSSSYNNSIILIENPVCANVHLSGTSYCLQEQSSSPFSANLTDCDPESCSQNISCSHPYEGVMIYRAPFFQDVTNKTVFKALEKTVYDKFGSSVGSVYLQNPYFDSNSYLRVELKLCPLTGTYFNRTQILIELDLGSQNYNTTPEIFGPYYFSASKYNFQGKGSSLSTGVTIGAVVGCTLLILGLVGVGIYALRQKKQVQRANEIINPFASWVHSGEDGGAAPQLKGARWFSYDEIRKCTNNFPEINVIGSGGYGKVYRGMLLNGQVVAIKRSQVGSNQGALEFKTEIELLSRVHHKNLLELVGFCFQQGERMVVYEYIPNGTLRESLSGKRGIQLDWKRRLKIALGSARGIAYLHELANPPIIHRDIKSTNILLDEKLNAKVADFGLSKLVSESEAENGSTDVKGTLGYLDPEYYMTQQLSEKSDVYSFGVVMLELVTATPPIHNGKYIVREVKMAIDENDEEYFGLKKIMDPVIQDARDLIGFRRFVELAIQCVEESSLNRPTMSDIVKEIEMILHSDGLDTSSVTASSPDRDFGITYNGSHYPYNDPFRRKDVSGSSFEYSGDSIFSLNVEPK